MSAYSFSEAVKIERLQKSFTICKNALKSGHFKTYKQEIVEVSVQK